MRFLQINVGRGREAHNVAFATADRIKADVIIIIEPNVKITEGGAWVKDRRKDVAIFLRKRMRKSKTTKYTKVSST